MVGVIRLATRTSAALGLASLLVSTAFAQHYTRTDLTTNSSTVSSAPNIDPNLVNPWGLSRATGSPWWISDNGTGLSTLYDGTGAIVPLVVTIPPPNGTEGTAAPTGTVFNFTTSFEVASGEPAVFLFVTEDGTISGWNPNVNKTAAVVKVNAPNQAIYKGCALAMTAAGPRLYVSNFKTGNVEVWDGNFHRQHAEERFKDKLPPNYSPFGIQNVGGNIVVTFAHRLPGSEDEDHGPGLGFVRVFDTNGNVLVRVQHGTYLNAPWGIALASGDFGPFSHRLLIGNFGDGTIDAFNAFSGQFEGTLLDANGANLSIDGLWAISFGDGTGKNGAGNSLYFTAGPDDESNGIFGTLTATDTEQRGNSE
ncbi:MAG TPA: TIGR03118 family protein [Candidatus Solibacter sp.]|nr:TIGR03118 family protein [Candidatus Solibacter sp.]